jgi:hypothetical protein
MPRGSGSKTGGDVSVDRPESLKKSVGGAARHHTCRPRLGPSLSLSPGTGRAAEPDSTGGKARAGRRDVHLSPDRSSRSRLTAGRRRRTDRMRPIDGRGTGLPPTCRRDGGPRLPRGQGHPLHCTARARDRHRDARNQIVNRASWIPWIMGGYRSKLLLRDAALEPRSRRARQGQGCRRIGARCLSEGAWQCLGSGYLWTATPAENQPTRGHQCPLWVASTQRVRAVGPAPMIGGIGDVRLPVTRRRYHPPTEGCGEWRREHRW